MDDDASQRQTDQQAREFRLEEGRRARDELFADVIAFSEAVGYVTAERGASGVLLTAGAKTLMFEEMGEGERVKLVFENSEKGQHRLFRIGEIDRWAWSFMRYGREERMLFWDDGLEELCVIALGLARPGEQTASSAPIDSGDTDDEKAGEGPAKPKRSL